MKRLRGLFFVKFMKCVRNR